MDPLHWLHKEDERRKTTYKQPQKRRTPEQEKEIKRKHDEWLAECQYNPRSHQNDWDLE